MSHAHKTYPENRAHLLSLWRGLVVPEVTPTYLSLWRGSILITDRTESKKAIVQTVADRHGFTASELRGPSRRGPLVMARAEAAWVMHQTGRYSYSQIAAGLGRKDHTTAIYLIQKWQSHLDGKLTPRLEKHAARLAEYHVKRKAREAASV